MLKWKVIRYIGLVAIWVGVFVFLAGCSEPTPEQNAATARLYAISLGQESVQNSLRDPNSIEWESKAINMDTNALCYIYRARNGFGGMTQGFAVIVDGKMHRTNKIFDKHCQVKGGKYETY